MIPTTASACLIFPSHQIARIDAELPKTKLTKVQVAQVKALRAKAADLPAANTPFDANRAA